MGRENRRGKRKSREYSRNQRKPELGYYVIVTERIIRLRCALVRYCLNWFVRLRKNCHNYRDALRDVVGNLPPIIIPSHGIDASSAASSDETGSAAFGGDCFCWPSRILWCEMVRLYITVL